MAIGKTPAQGNRPTWGPGQLPRYPTIGAAMTNTGFALAGIGVLLIGWYLVVLAMHLVTRPRGLRPGPPLRISAASRPPWSTCW